MSILQIVHILQVHSDGTSAGTVLAKDINLGQESANPFRFTPSGNRTFFIADDGETGKEVWAWFSDGVGVYLPLISR